LAVITQPPGAAWVKTRKPTLLHSTEYSCLWVKKSSVCGISCTKDQVQETQVM